MGNNIQKFFLLNSNTGWRLSESDNVSYSEIKKGLCLDKVPLDLKDSLGSFGGLEIPTGFAVDKYGKIFIVDTEADRIIVYNLCANAIVPLKYIGGKGRRPRKFNFPKGIAVSSSNNIYISDKNNHRIQVFSVKGLALRDIWGKVDVNGEPLPGNADKEFNNPWDIAVDSDDNIYVVDKSNNRIQKFDKFGNFLIKFGASQLSNPENIFIDNLSQIYVTDNTEKIKIYKNDGEYIDEIESTKNIKAKVVKPSITIDVAGRIHYNIKLEKYPFSYRRKSKQIKSEEECFDNLTGVLPGLYFENNKLVITEQLPKPIPEEDEFVKEGKFYTEPLDSKIYKCPWYKILLDGEFPFGTSVLFETYTSEIEKDFLEIKNMPDNSWQTDQVNANNFLNSKSSGKISLVKNNI